MSKNNENLSAPVILLHGGSTPAKSESFPGRRCWSRHARTRMKWCPFWVRLVEHRIPLV